MLACTHAHDAAAATEPTCANPLHFLRPTLLSCAYPNSKTCGHATPARCQAISSSAFKQEASDPCSPQLLERYLRCASGPSPWNITQRLEHCPYKTCSRLEIISQLRWLQRAAPNSTSLACASAPPPCAQQCGASFAAPRARNLSWTPLDSRASLLTTSSISAHVSKSSCANSACAACCTLTRFTSCGTTAKQRVSGAP